MSTARSAVSKPTATKDRWSRRVMNERASVRE
jgi:hypothetical protein